MYSTRSKTTKEVCEKIGFDFEVSFVDTMKRNGKVFVRGTMGKPQEYRELQYQCEKHGYIYTGRKC